MEDPVLSFAVKHNLDGSDVRKYAQSMKMKNLGGASYAFKSISRSVRLQNSDLSLGQFVKAFSPIKKELYEKFGDVDSLRDEYVQHEMEARNMAEAARNRAEKVAEAENMRLQEFRAMDAEVLDYEYLKAAETNDTPRMRDLVNEAARRRGYVSAGEFRMAHHAPSYDEEGTDKNFIDIAGNKDLIRESLNEQLRMNRDKCRDESAAAINRTLSAIDGGKEPAVTIYRAVPGSLKEGKVRNGDWVSLSESYAKQHGNHALNGEYRIMKEVVPAGNLYWDGNDINEWGYDDRSDYRYKDVKNNRKLNDPVTHDDRGNIIPLSKRFNSRREDVRFRFIGEKGASSLDMAEEGTARLDNLSVARRMEDAGKEPLSIKAATGWERGADRLWRYEQPDFVLRETLLQRGTEGQIVVPLRDVISDDSLFRAYPFLEGTVIAEEKGDKTAFYQSSLNIIGLNTKKFATVKKDIGREEIMRVENRLEELEKLPEVREYNRMFETYRPGDDEKIDRFLETCRTVKEYSELEDRQWELYHKRETAGYMITDRETLIHEVQHAIQDFEGFARGGSPDEFGNTKVEIIRDLNFYTSGDFMKDNVITDGASIIRALGKTIPFTDISLYAGYADGLERVARKYGYKNIGDLAAGFDGVPSALEQYHRLSGEVEARNAGTRAGLSPEERRCTLAVTTEDVVRKDQIILDAAKERMELAGYASFLAEKQNIPVSVINSYKDIPSDRIRRLIDRKADIRGWYDIPSERVCLYLPNAAGKADIQQTILHEGVAHYGLRKLVGNENMDGFLDNVYAAADEKIRRNIGEMALVHKLNVREATEEYLAKLAEEDITPCFREKIKRLLTGMLRALGFNIDIRDSDLCRILSKSKENLQSSPFKNNNSLFLKGGRREIEITPERAVIRANGHTFDATGILRTLQKAKVDVGGISGMQWQKMLKGQGTVLDPSAPGRLFSIQKQASGYGIRIADITGSITKPAQQEINY